MDLYSSHVFSFFSFHTRTLVSNFLCQVFVALNHMSITSSLCFGTHSLLEITLTLRTLALSSCRTHGVEPKNMIARHHENLLDFVEQGMITEAEEPTVRVGAIPSKLTAPPPQPPILRRMPFLPRNPPNLSWLAYPVAWFIPMRYGLRNKIGSVT